MHVIEPSPAPVAAGGNRALRWWEDLRRWEAAATDRLVLGLLVGLGFVLRAPRLPIRYWGDEAIAVGIAQRPVGQIPHYLGFDGSPPLWYILLHGWIGVFGHSEVATHFFSLVVSLLAIPVAWWCGRALFGPRAARAAALLAAVSPYLAYYGTETRMYALLGVLSMVAVTAFLRFWQEAGDGDLRGAAGRWLAGAAVAAVAVLYTHNWGLFLVGVMVGGGVVLAWRRGDGVRAGRVALFGLIVAAGYAPWVPHFVSQLRTTGAPWAPHPSVLDLFGDPFNIACSAAWFVMVAGIGVAVMARRRTRPASSPRWSWEIRSPLGLGAALVVATVLAGWAACQVVHAWAPRYLGVAVVPALVVLGALFAETPLGRRALVVVAFGLACTSLPVLVNPGGFADSKSNVAAVDHAVMPDLATGDLVVTTDLSELPVIAYYLPGGLRYATPLGVVSDPRVVDWQHLPTRLQAAEPTVTLAAVLASLPVGGHVVVINPTTFGPTSPETPARFAGTVAAEGVAVNQDILLDPDFQATHTVIPKTTSGISSPVEATVYTRVH